MRVVVFVYWKEGVEPDAVTDFVQHAPQALAQGPFTSWWCGSGAPLVKTAASWAFGADMAGEREFRDWQNCAAHDGFVGRLNRVARRIDSVQIPNPVVSS